MIEINSGAMRPTFDVMLDGTVRKIPYTLTQAEMKQIGKATDRGDDREGALDWFVEFLRPHLGPVVDELNDITLTAIMDEWGRRRKEAGAPDMGEPSASPE